MRLTGFQDKLAFVTGAAGGIGLSVVSALLEAGARVVATDLPQALHAGLPQDAEWLALDVQDGAAVDAAIEGAQARHGPLALGVHAAGILGPGGPLTDLPAAEWDRVFAINAGGTFHTTRAMGRAMQSHGKGAIVTVSSNAAGIPRMGMGAYAASKAAATMMTRCLGIELAAHGVRCNIIAPGSTLTPMQTGMWADAHGAEKVIAGDLASYRTGIPLQKLASPEDIANAVMFMLSDQAGHVSMADLYVDGGATLRA